MRWDAVLEIVNSSPFFVRATMMTPLVAICPSNSSKSACGTEIEAFAMQLTQLHIYPLKSAQRLSLESAEVESRGLAFDRRWVVVDPQGQFLHQRILPRLSTLKTRADHDGLWVADSENELHIPRPQQQPRLEVTVWDDKIQAIDAGHEAAEWFTRLLDRPARLAYMDGDARRPLADIYNSGSDEVSFADAAPILLTSEASLSDLNLRLPDPIPMDRFRANLVVDGLAAWEEDRWKEVTVGDVAFRVTHGCARCVATTVDQDTGKKSPDGEPLKTLATFRRREDGVYFGLNLVPMHPGQVHVGDAVTPKA